MADLTEQLSAEQAVERQELDEAFRKVFATNEGKRILFWMLSGCAIYEDAFTGDDNVTNYRLGLQAGGRKLIAKLDEIEPRFYPQLLLAIADIKALDKAAAVVATKQETDEDE